MSSHTSRARVGVIAVLALAMALAGCSDGEDASPTSSSSGQATDVIDASPDGDESDDEGTAEAQQALADAIEGEGERPFGADDDALAVAMQAATRADRVQVDGGTFRLHFDEGSVEDVNAFINCSAMNSIKGDTDSVVMVYADGELNCDDEPE